MGNQERKIIVKDGDYKERLSSMAGSMKKQNVEHERKSKKVVEEKKRRKSSFNLFESNLKNLQVP